MWVRGHPPARTRPTARAARTRWAPFIVALLGGVPLGPVPGRPLRDPLPRSALTPSPPPGAPFPCIRSGCGRRKARQHDGHIVLAPVVEGPVDQRAARLLGGRVVGKDARDLPPTHHVREPVG